LLYTRAKPLSLGLVGLSLICAVVLLALTLDKDDIHWLEAPWIELGVGTIVVAFALPLLGLLLSKGDRVLCLSLLAVGMLACVGAIMTEGLVPLLLGLAIGLLFGAIVRIASLIGKTPAGVAVAGAWWALVFTPCGGGPVGPLIALFTLGYVHHGSGFSTAGEDLIPLLGMTVCFIPFYVLFAIGGAALNVWIYRSNRRKLWQQSDYASTLRRARERTADGAG
jgi:hypothetical protein